MIRLRLFIAGDNVRSKNAVRNLRQVCEDLLGGEYELDLIDVLEQPELADEARVLATPTVIRLAPPPLRRAVGDLSDLGALADALDLTTHDNAKSDG